MALLKANTGIGTTNPTSALTVKGDTSIETLNVSGVSTFQNLVRFQGDTSIETLNVSGVSTFQNLVRFQGNVLFEDSDVLYFGNGNDLEIYHNQFGPLNVIRSNASMFFGVTNEVIFADASTGLSTVAKFRPGFSNAELYYAGNKKFETIGAGVTITGTTFTNQLSVSGVSTSSTVNDSKGDVRVVPQNSKSSSYILVSGDSGKHISITTGGVTVPASVFSIGDVVTIFNNSGSNQTITQGASTTLRQAGTANTGNRTLSQYGLATILCVASNTFVISGAGLS